MPSNHSHQDHVCPAWASFMLDNVIRRLLHRPARIVGEYIRPGATVIDLGCGPGFFTIPMARMVGPAGRVIAVDVQQKMLDKLRRRTIRAGLQERITPHLCPGERIALQARADFMLAFYMVHETPDQAAFLREARSLLAPGGRFLVVEPRFHVSPEHFAVLRETARAAGFTIAAEPTGKGGFSLLLSA